MGGARARVDGARRPGERALTALRVTVHAHAKLNWTLEVLGKRPDGYHEIRSIMQTIDLSDTLLCEEASDITLAMDGPLAVDLASDDNLAYRAAALLRERARGRSGAHIALTKRIPVAAGLGGGSSDAAAVLRALRVLWELNISTDELVEIGAQLGSDVPFFLCGGTAVASGRGALIDALPDAPQQSVLLSSRPPRVPIDKTARMYAALRPEHYTDGSRTEALAERIRCGEAVRDEDCFNVFESVLAEVDPEAGAAFEAARDAGKRPHLCGSGPTYFTLGSGAPTISAADAVRISESR
jgi:4-diphosphocytidyl-2-C-methyl-D-erythritol kinase